MGLGGSAPEILLDSLLWLLPAFAIAWAFLRNVPLALAVALAPLPGIGLEALLRLGWVYTYPFGFCVGLLMSGALLRRFLSASGNWRGVSLAAGGAVAAATMHDLEGVRILVLCLCAASAVGLVALAWRVLPFGEAFIARANRAAENRARLLDIAAQVAVPRWAMAVSGIAVVMAALAWFEIMPGDPPDYPGFVVAAAAVFLLSRDWRTAVAAALCAALLWLARADIALPFFVLPALLLSACVRERPERGAEAWRLTLEEEGGGLWFAALGLAVLLILDGAATFLELGLAAQIAFLVALVFFPALAAALWTLFPRYRSVEEIYRD
jgi:hypothetical protein